MQKTNTTKLKKKKRKKIRREYVSLVCELQKNIFRDTQYTHNQKRKTLEDMGLLCINLWVLGVLCAFLIAVRSFFHDYIVLIKRGCWERKDKKQK